MLRWGGLGLVCETILACKYRLKSTNDWHDFANICSDFLLHHLVDELDSGLE